VVAEVPEGVIAVDANDDRAYVLDVDGRLLTTLALPPGTGVRSVAVLRSDEALAATGDGGLLVLRKDGSVEAVEVELPDDEAGGAVGGLDAERTWQDGAGGAVVELEGGVLARWGGVGRPLGPPWFPDLVELPAGVEVGELAAVGDGAMWWWTSDGDALVRIPLEVLGPPAEGG
jgi:hypothetical protein